MQEKELTRARRTLAEAGSRRVDGCGSLRRAKQSSSSSTGRSPRAERPSRPSGSSSASRARSARREAELARRERSSTRRPRRRCCGLDEARGGPARARAAPAGPGAAREHELASPGGAGRREAKVAAREDELVRRCRGQASAAVELDGKAAELTRRERESLHARPRSGRSGSGGDERARACRGGHRAAPRARRGARAGPREARGLRPRRARAGRSAPLPQPAVLPGRGARRPAQDRAAQRNLLTLQALVAEHRASSPTAPTSGRPTCTTSAATPTLPASSPSRSSHS